MQYLQWKGSGIDQVHYMRCPTIPNVRLCNAVFKVSAPATSNNNGVREVSRPAPADESRLEPRPAFLKARHPLNLNVADRGAIMDALEVAMNTRKPDFLRIVTHVSNWAVRVCTYQVSIFSLD